MIYKERQTIVRLKRRIAFLLVIILILLYWIRTKHQDLEFKEYEVESLTYDSFEKDDEIRNLRSQLNKLQSKTNSKQETPKLINTKKEKKVLQESVDKKDTNVKVVNSSPEQQQELLDTLNR